jgi:type I restriction enzyme M protein
MSSHRRVTHVSEHLLPLTPVYTAGEGGGEGEYKDIPGFCKSAPLEDVRKHGHVLTPGRYVGAEALEDDDEPFEEKMRRLTIQLEVQFAESARLEEAIRRNLNSLGLGDLLSKAK